MGARRAAWRLLACAVMGLAVSSGLGVGYATRHSSHDGFYRASVHDPGPSVHPSRPRRTVVFVVDGLGHLEAEAMPSLARLGEIGQCRVTDVGPLSVSRPVYAVMSTGLEQDRTGARGNDDTTPLAAESIWAIARHAGLRVSGVSEVPWWQELFPDGFDAYVVAPPGQDYVPLAPPADVQLVHPVYVDDIGHESGAGSAAYRQAVVRVNGEIEELLATLDLSRDLVLVTADHGHTLRGGHGGRQDRVARTLSCYAGVGVRPMSARGTMSATLIAPSLALLLGLPFPSSMRAGEDDLDTLFAIADPAAFPAGYLEERQATVERFRAANAARLRGWLSSSDGRWSRFRAYHREQQALGVLPCVLLALLVLAIQAGAQWRRGRSAWFGSALVLGLFAAMLITQVAVHGSFDLSSVSTREDFLTFTILMSLAWCALAAYVDLRVRGDAHGLVLDWTALSLIATLLAVVHPLVFGWRVGYPAPPAELFFYPYFAALALGAVQVTAIVLVAYALRTTASESGAKR